MSHAWRAGFDMGQKVAVSMRNLLTLNGGSWQRAAKSAMGHELGRQILLRQAQWGDKDAFSQGIKDGWSTAL